MIYNVIHMGPSLYTAPVSPSTNTVCTKNMHFSSNDVKLEFHKAKAQKLVAQVLLAGGL